MASVDNSKQQLETHLLDPSSTKDQAEAPGDSSSSTLFSSPGITDTTASALPMYVLLLNLGTAYCLTLTYHSVFPVMALQKTSCYV